MEFVLTITAVIAAICAFDYAAVRWGHDSRDDFRSIKR
jgi:hypothetical protein